MTSNQIAYNEYAERARSNLVSEAETKRHNEAFEAETARHNKVMEDLGWEQLHEQRSFNALDIANRQEQTRVAWSTAQLNASIQKYIGSLNYAATTYTADRRADAAIYSADKVTAGNVFNAFTNAASSRDVARINTSASLQANQARVEADKLIAARSQQNQKDIAYTQAAEHFGATILSSFFGLARMK